MDKLKEFRDILRTIFDIPTYFFYEDLSEEKMPYIIMSNIDGETSLSKYNNKRYSEGMIIFDSYSTDARKAYENACALQDIILEKKEIFKNFEVSETSIEGIKNLSFSQGRQNIYRYQVQIEVEYDR